MGRRAVFNSDSILEAALSLASREGPEGVTIAAISRETGAPIGSIYHRFVSRDRLMAAVWLRIVQSFQQGFIKALENDDGLSAALHTPRCVRDNPRQARVLLLFRREELMAGEWPDGVKDEAVSLAKTLDDAIRHFTARRFGRESEEFILKTAFALIDVPYASVKRCLQNEKQPPETIDRLIKTTYHAIFGEDHENLQRP
jgi:AcrR family transcriptional regulator